MNQTLILIAAALVVGIGGGYVIGTSTSTGDSDPTMQSSARSLGPRASGSGSSGKSSRKGSKRYSGFQEINRLPGTSNRVQALVQYYQGLSLQQLEDEANKLEDLPVGERIMASMLLFSRWGEVNPYTAFDYANGLGWAGMLVRPTVLQSWASMDPASGSYRAIAESYGAKDFASAQAWISTLPADQQGAATASAISGLARTDPMAAAAQVATMEGGSAKDRAVTDVMGSIAQNDPAAAAEFLAQNNPPYLPMKAPSITSPKKQIPSSSCRIFAIQTKKDTKSGQRR